MELPSRNAATAIILATLAVSASGAGAAELRISLSSRVTYDEPVVLNVEVVNPDRSLERVRPRLPPVEGLRIQGPYDGGIRSSTRIVGGRRTSSVTHTFQYRVTPERGRTGTFRLGPATVTPPGRPPIRSNTVELGVYRRPELGLRFHAELPSESGVVGEPFRVVYRLSYPQGSLDEGPELESMPILGLSGAWVTPVKAFENREANRAGWKREGRGPETLVVQESFVVHPDGTAEPAIFFAFEVVPLRTGRITIGSARARARLRTGETVIRRDFFGHRRVPQTRAFEAETEEIVYRVKPLPEEGRPPGFSGAVGRFTIAVDTGDREVNAYDPIQLTVTVRPHPSVKADTRKILEELPAPRWREVPSLTEDFDILADVDAGEVTESAKVFRQVVRPLSDAVTEIPSLPFPYYDPWKREYAVARSEPIPVTVHAGGNVGLDETIVKSPADSGLESARAPSPIHERRGVAANFDEPGEPGRFLDPRSSVTGLPFLAALAVPPVLFALLGLILRAARKTPEARARERAFPKAREALSAGEGDAGAVTEIYQDYFRERFRLPPGELTPAQLRAELTRREVPEALADRAGAHLEELLASRFGGAASDGARLSDRALEILGEVERCAPRR